jgi:hypothetical protein
MRARAGAPVPFGFADDAPFAERWMLDAFACCSKPSCVLGGAI